MSDGEDGSGNSSSSTPNSHLPLDEMLDLLTDRTRRSFLHCLAEEADPTISLDDAAAYVANHIEKESGANTDENKIKAKLHHHHIPRLKVSSLVDFDERTETIRYHENERLEEFHNHLLAFEQD